MSCDVIVQHVLASHLQLPCLAHDLVPVHGMVRPRRVLVHVLRAARHLDLSHGAHSVGVRYHPPAGPHGDPLPHHAPVMGAHVGGHHGVALVGHSHPPCHGVSLLHHAPSVVGAHVGHHHGVVRLVGHPTHTQGSGHVTSTTGGADHPETYNY